MTFCNKDASGANRQVSEVLVNKYEKSKDSLKRVLILLEFIK